jgi:N-alpha-acetyltransferase 35, NatC auxiliary subunit
MDPKMDSGYLKPGETMEDDYDFSQPLLPEEIIGIIDQLLCHEVFQDLQASQYAANLTDGMAHGSSARPNDIHELVHR